VFRVVQESLTNVLRHAGSTKAVVTVSYEASGVHVVVENAAGVRCDGSTRGSGHGLTGMRERVTEMGGTVDARRDSSGAFRVSAWLPLYPRR
jgi:signal transduction histidine kinase